MTISRKQSLYVPTWATGGNYPAGSDPWSGTAMRVPVSGVEAAAGVAPRAQLPAQWVNYHHGVAFDHLAALADIYAINWPEFGSTEPDACSSSSTVTYGTLLASSKVGGLGGQYDPWLWLSPQISGGTGFCYRSRDGQHWQVGGDPPSFSGQPVDVLGFGSKAVLMTDDGADCLVWFSSDAALTWSAGPFTLPNGGGNPNYTKIAWIQSASIYVASGANCLATSPDLATWTSRSTQSTNAAVCIAAAGEDETAVGAIIARNSNEISWSLDGVTWANRTVGSSNFVGACWSEVQQAWYALNADGQLYRSDDLTDNWVQIADLYGPAGDSFTRPGVTLQAWGKNLVILGDQIRVANTVGMRSGMILAYDPTNAYGFAVNPNPGYASGERPFDRLVRHDGRLVAARTHLAASPYVHMAMSMRAPWGVE